MYFGAVFGLLEGSRIAFPKGIKRSVLKLIPCEKCNDFHSFVGLLGREKKPHRYYDYSSFGPSGDSGAEWLHPVILEAIWAIL